jgi:hypothetical protein
MNPKDAIGRSKVGLSNCPIEVLLELACALTEGKLKYGAYNWRKANVFMTVYTDAAIRHLASFLVREDIDPDSGLHHVTKAIASLVILRDAIIHNCAIDDRPPNGIQVQAELNEKVAALVEKYPPKDTPQGTPQGTPQVSDFPKDKQNEAYLAAIDKQFRDLSDTETDKLPEVEVTPEVCTRLYCKSWDGYCNYDLKSNVPDRGLSHFYVRKSEYPHPKYIYVLQKENVKSYEEQYGVKLLQVNICQR